MPAEQEREPQEVLPVTLKAAQAELAHLINRNPFHESFASGTVDVMHGPTCALSDDMGELVGLGGRVSTKLLIGDQDQWVLQIKTAGLLALVDGQVHNFYLAPLKGEKQPGYQLQHGAASVKPRRFINFPAQETLQPASISEALTFFDWIRSAQCSRPGWLTRRLTAVSHNR